MFTLEPMHKVITGTTTGLWTALAAPAGWVTGRPGFLRHSRRNMVGSSTGLRGRVKFLRRPWSTTTISGSAKLVPRSAITLPNYKHLHRVDLKAPLAIIAV